MIKKIIGTIYTDAASALQYQQFWRFFCAILAGILMVKAGWNIETIAIYELFFFAAHLLSFAWSTGVNNALLSYFPSISVTQQRVLLFNVALLMISISILVAVLFLLFESRITEFLTGEAALPYTHWITLFLICSPASILIQAIYLLRSEPEKITNYTHIIFVSQLLVMITAILIVGTVEALIIGIVIWSVMKFSWLITMIFKYTDLKFDSPLFKTFALFSVPLILQFILSNSMEYVDGIIVNQYFDTAEFPVFRYGAKELPITVILVVSLTSALIPLAVKDLNTTLREMKNRTRKLMHILFPLSAALILISPLVYQWVYSEAYIASAQLFNIYLLILCARILLPQVIMYAEQRNTAILWITTVELVINISLSIWWVQSMGLAGIAYATLVANIFYTVSLIIYTKVNLNIESSRYIPWKVYSMYVLLLTGAFVASTQIYNYG